MENEVAEARKKLAERFAATQIGGKGTALTLTPKILIILTHYNNRNSEKEEEACELTECERRQETDFSH